MVEIDTETDRRHGVTFVNAIVTNTRSTAQTVRLESRLDGPTWPPRRGRLAAPEWSDDCWEGVVEPGQSIGVGFASPAEPSAPPLELVSAERTPGDRSSNTRRQQQRHQRHLLADLEEWSPPSAVLSRER